MANELRQVVKPVTPADKWVARDPADEPMKRLTIDVPLSLHTKLKTECAASEQKIADVVRNLITEHLKKVASILSLFLAFLS
jgi:hypothetical protein